MPAYPITTTARQLALKSPTRKSITFTGDLAGTAIFYLTVYKLGSAAPSTTVFDFAIGAGIQTTFDIINDDPELVRSAWYGISDTVTKVIAVSET